MSNLNEFLQEFSKLCIKYDKEIDANSLGELVVSNISNGETVATDLLIFFYSKQITYTDINDKDIDLDMKD